MSSLTELIPAEWGAIAILIISLIIAVVYFVRKDDAREIRERDFIEKTMIPVIINNTTALNAFVDIKKKCDKYGKRN